MHDTTVTVFGGTGFLGRVIVRHLTEAGMRVRIAARNPHRFTPGGLNGRIEKHAVDIRDETSVAAAVAGATAVVNAVGLYVESRGLTFDAVHVDGAARVARLARETGASRIIHISGIGADPASPSRYVAARGRGEAAVRAATANSIILRPSVLFGPGDAFVSTLAALTRLPVIPLFGDGSTRLQPVHVDDVAAAVARVMTRQKTAGRSYELGGAEIFSYRAILEAVMAATGRRRPMLPIPFPAWHLLATIAGMLPRPPLTRDQVLLMQADNIVSAGVDGFAELGLEPRSLTAALSGALDQP
jgi:uncharacterized protein YbjT (DUF2867 family)